MAAAAAVEATVTMSKAVAPRSWVLIDSQGETKVIDADKYTIMEWVQIDARDLRILDPLLSYPSTILCRQQAIVLNLEHIKAIITEEKLELFLNVATTCLSIYSLIARIFGMNIPYQWNSGYGYVFKWVVIFGALVSLVLFILHIAFARYRGLLGS